MNQLFAYFIPQRFNDNMDLYRRSHLVVLGSINYIVSAIIYSIIFKMLGYSVLAGYFLVFGVIGACVPFILKSTQSISLCGNIIVGTFWLLVFIISYYTGGLFAASAIWFGLNPLMATIFNGVRSGILWGLLSSAGFAIFYLMKTAGYELPAPVPFDEQTNAIYELCVYFGFPLVIMYYSIFYEGTKNKVLKKLTNAVEMKQLTGSIKDLTVKISGFSQELSQDSAEQAASVEEIASSISQIDSQANTNARNSKDAEELVSTAQTSVGSGNDKMKALVKMMENIAQTSAEIFKMLKIIDSITFQTKLLSLNAAVEAARTGEDGQGFAVVAEEMRNLADRSAQSAKKIETLIVNSNHEIKNGTEIAREMDVSLDQIAGQINRVTQLIADISAASDQQSRGTAQVSEGIGQIDEVIQTNAAKAEESASTVTTLNEMTQSLFNLVKKFGL